MKRIEPIGGGDETGLRVLAGILGLAAFIAGVFLLLIAPAFSEVGGTDLGRAIQTGLTVAAGLALFANGGMSIDFAASGTAAARRRFGISLLVAIALVAVVFLGRDTICDGCGAR